MSLIKTFRLLKRDQPDRGKVEKLFAKKDDQVLLGAIANPEHSEAARQILQELADQRGLQKAVDVGWAQTDESMYVEPFGRQPTFEQALAAPRRRRFVYRSLQYIMMACLTVGLAMLLQLGPFAGLVKPVTDPGVVDPATTAQLRNLTPPLSDQEIFDYLDGRKLFANDLRQTYVDFLVEGEAVDKDVLQQYLQAVSADKNKANIEMVDLHNGVLGESIEVDEYIHMTKESAYLAAVTSLNQKFAVGGDADVIRASGGQENLEAFFNLVNSEIDLIIENDGDNVVAFDHFEKSARLAPPGHWTESVGIMLVLGGPILWFFGGMYSWLRPSRILLLRPFQTKKVSRPLKRFMKKNVSYHGHTITLSDKYVKESFWNHVLFWIPRSPYDIPVIFLFFIPAIRQFKRYLKVDSAHSYGFLQNRLARRFTMNMFWQSASNKLLKVKCSDTWWKQCVDLLMYSCQLIVVDLSWVKVGTEWELDKINRRDLEEKTVFVVGEDAAEYAREVIAKFWHDAEAPPPLYVYVNSGKLQEHEAFERDVARIISESHLWQGVPEAP